MNRCDYGAYQSYTSTSGKNSSYFQNLPYSAQYGIMLTSLYGWAPGRSIPVSGCNEDDFLSPHRRFCGNINSCYAQVLQAERQILSALIRTPITTVSKADLPKSVITGFWSIWLHIRPFRALLPIKRVLLQLIR